MLQPLPIAMVVKPKLKTDACNGAKSSKWAAAHGVVIPPVHHAGKSLSAMWKDLELKFAAEASQK